VPPNPPRGMTSRAGFVAVLAYAALAVAGFMFAVLL
jgi:hypothetical protein